MTLAYLPEAMGTAVKHATFSLHAAGATPRGWCQGGVSIALSCLAMVAISWAATAWGAQKYAEEGGYIFHLKNGSQIHTLEFWEEGSDYRIERFGGVIGLHKGDVLRIERVQNARKAPTPVSAQPAVVEAFNPDVPQGALVQLQIYIAELIEWVRSWLARVSGSQRARESVQVGAGQRLAQAPEQAAGPATARGLGANPWPSIAIPLIAILVVVPTFLFSGKMLGTRLFGTVHT